VVQVVECLGKLEALSSNILKNKKEYMKGEGDYLGREEDQGWQKRGQQSSLYAGMRM
jgi:hypothetical protein